MDGIHRVLLDFIFFDSAFVIKYIYRISAKGNNNIVNLYLYDSHVGTSKWVVKYFLFTED